MFRDAKTFNCCAGSIEFIILRSARSANGNLNFLIANFCSIEKSSSTLDRRLQFSLPLFANLLDQIKTKSWEFAVHFFPRELLQRVSFSAHEIKPRVLLLIKPRYFQLKEIASEARKQFR